MFLILFSPGDKHEIVRQNVSYKHNGIQGPALAIVFGLMNISRGYYDFVHNSIEKSKSVSSRESP